MDGIQPAVKSALTKAYKQGSNSRVVRAADLINIPGMKKPLKKRVAAILEPVEESLPEENGLASAEDDEDDSSDTENNGVSLSHISDITNRKNQVDAYLFD